MNQENKQEKTFNPEQFDIDFVAFTKEVPNIVDVIAPDGASKREQMGEFLSDQVVNPKCIYPKLDTLTEEQVLSYRESAKRLLDQVTLLAEPHRAVYEAFIKQNLLQTDLVVAMKSYNDASTSDEKDSARKEFMRLNVELYGEPDRDTYYSLLSEKIANISSKELSPEAQVIFEQLKGMLPVEALDPERATARFQPSSETVAWMHGVVSSLVGGMLRHVPDTSEQIDSAGLATIFENIIHEEFGESAEDWKVVRKEAKAISVGARGKVVIVPIDRPSMSVSEVRRLVAHELGIHMLTAITGESTDIAPLNYGLAGYADTQEGLGKVAEQALENRFVEAGVDHYITAGLVYYDNKDFRGAFEAKWRIKLLEDIEAGAMPTTEQIENSRKIAADGPLLATSRIFRGTDELPLFKDLSYYNGSQEVWKYLEKIRGDELLLGLLLAGKISTTKEHQRVVLESSTI